MSHSFFRFPFLSWYVSHKHTHTHKEIAHTHMHTHAHAHTHHSDFLTAAQSLAGNRWRKISDLSCAWALHTGLFFSRSFSNTTPKQSITCFQPMAYFQANLRKTISFHSGNGFTHSENTPSSRFHHLFIRALHIRCHLIWCCSVAGEQGAIIGSLRFNA